MALEIEGNSRITGAVEKVKSADNRLSVSSRVADRAYYSSRDMSQSFSLVWDDSSSAAGDFIVYWKNTDATGKVLVIDSIGVNSANAASFKLHMVTGTAGGTTVTPVCLNQSAIKSASSASIEAAGTPITGLTSSALVDHVGCTAGGHEEFRLRDRLRIGQDGAIAIEYEQGTAGRTWGVIYGFFEDV